MARDGSKRIAAPCLQQLMEAVACHRYLFLAFAMPVRAFRSDPSWVEDLRIKTGLSEIDLEFIGDDPRKVLAYAAGLDIYADKIEEDIHPERWMPVGRASLAQIAVPRFKVHPSGCVLLEKNAARLNLAASELEQAMKRQDTGGIVCKAMAARYPRRRVRRWKPSLKISWRYAQCLQALIDRLGRLGCTPVLGPDLSPQDHGEEGGPDLLHDDGAYIGAVRITRNHWPVPPLPRVSNRNKALKKILASYPEISRQQPRANRLKVHLVEWLDYVEEQRRILSQGVALVAKQGHWSCRSCRNIFMNDPLSATCPACNSDDITPVIHVPRK